MYSDGNFSTAQPHGAPVTVRPFYELRDLNHVILSQMYMVNRAAYVPTPLGTAHPTISGLFLANETADTDALCGLMEFTRTYINKPSNRSDYESFNYNYLPILRAQIIGSIMAKEGGSRTVTSRVQRDYFRIGTGLDYDEPLDIPIIPRFFPTYQFSGATTAEARWIGYSADGGTSTPDEAAYFALGEIVAEDSNIDHYRGDVWVRSTRYVPVGTPPL